MVLIIEILFLYSFGSMLIQGWSHAFGSMLIQGWSNAFGSMLIQGGLIIALCRGWIYCSL